MYNNYKDKYLKYKNKYLLIKQNIQSAGKYYGNDISPYSTIGHIENKDLPLAIFHAFNMSFNDINNKLKEIKNFGFTHIQVSPIQECRTQWGDLLLNKKTREVNRAKDAGYDYKSNIPWFFAYQPKSLKIGNMYGTKEEFKNLVINAHAEGIKIIVDVVINHIAAFEEAEWGKWSIILKFFCNNDKYNKEKSFEVCTTNFDENYTNYVKETNKINEINKTRYLLEIAEYEKDKNREKPTEKIFQLYSLEEIKECYNYIINSMKYYMENEKLSDSECFNLITPPFWCSDGSTRPPQSWRCWLAQSLPQLNQDNPAIQDKIKKYLETLANLKVDGIRIDAIGHIKADIVHAYIEYFNEKRTGKKDSNEVYSYGEVINTYNQGDESYDMNMYYERFPVTDYMLYYNFNGILKNISYDSNNLSDKPYNLLLINKNSKRNDDVVFAETHDTIKPKFDEPALSGEILDEKNLIIFNLILLQRIYDVPLLLPYHFFKDYSFEKFKNINTGKIESIISGKPNNSIIRTLKFRELMKNEGINNEHNYIDQGINANGKSWRFFKSDKKIGDMVKYIYEINLYNPSEIYIKELKGDKLVIIL